MDAEEIRRMSAAAERMAAGMSGFDRDAWQAMAEQWTILARLREGLSSPQKKTRAVSPGRPG
jgi:hypothetical protein